MSGDASQSKRSPFLFPLLLVAAIALAFTYWMIGTPGDGWSRFSEQDFLEECDVALGPPGGNGDIFCGCLLDELKDRDITADEALDDSEGFGAGFSAGVSCGARGEF